MLIEVKWDCLEGNHGYCELEGCTEDKGVVWQRKVVWKHLLWMAKFVGVGVSGRSRLVVEEDRCGYGGELQRRW